MEAAGIERSCDATKRYIAVDRALWLSGLAGDPCITLHPIAPKPVPTCTKGLYHARRFDSSIGFRLASRAPAQRQCRK